MKIILLLLTALYSIASIAEPVIGPPPRMPGDLYIEVVASESDDYLKEWVSTAPSNPVTIKRIKAVKPEQLIVSSFLVTGLTANSEGKYAFAVSFALFNPDGTIMFKQENFAGGRGILPDKPMYAIADPALDLILEKSDPPGVYTIFGFVRDLVSGNTAKNRYKVSFENN